VDSKQKKSRTWSEKITALSEDEDVKCLGSGQDVSHKSWNTASNKDLRVMQVKKTSTKVPTAIERVLEIFPEMEIKFMRKSLLDGGIPTNEQDVPLNSGFKSVLQVIISSFSENPSYPKEPKKAKSLNSSTSSERMTNSPLHDYSSPSAEYERSHGYKLESAEYLVSTFPFLTSLGATEYLKAFDTRFFLCHERICDIIKGKGTTEKSEDTELLAEKQLNEMERVLAGGQISKEQTNSLHSSIGAAKRKRITRKRPLKSGGFTPTVTDPILLDEIQFTTKKYVEWKAQLSDSIARRLAREMSEKEGTTLECSCCFGDYAFEEMVSCKNEGHLFCFDCLKRHASERVFGVGDLGGTKTVGDEIELKCMHTGKTDLLYTITIFSNSFSKC
jgi:hypothetical protein